MATRTTRLVLALGLVSLPLAARAQSMDHLACFKVKDSAPPGRFEVTLPNATGSNRCIVRTPAKIACVPTAKTDVSPAPPGGGPGGSAAGSFLCYRLKCPRPSFSTNVQDQFGQRVVAYRGTRFMCAPADVAPPPAGLPPTPTTTTTLPGQDNCRFQDGECRGTCAPGQRCGSAVGSGSCECRNVSCGNADAPECDGFCSNAGEACIFDLSGCSCVNVP